MKVVYIAGKFTASDSWQIAKNVRAAETLAFAVAEVGAMPLCPHANTAHFYGTLTEEFWYAGTLELLKRCDAMILVPGWENSKGVKEEMQLAREMGLPILHTIEALKAWLIVCRHCEVE